GEGQPLVAREAGADLLEGGHRGTSGVLGGDARRERYGPAGAVKFRARRRDPGRCERVASPLHCTPGTLKLVPFVDQTEARTDPARLNASSVEWPARPSTDSTAAAGPKQTIGWLGVCQVSVQLAVTNEPSHVTRSEPCCGLPRYAHVSSSRTWPS